MLRRAAAYLSQVNLPGKRRTRSSESSPSTGSSDGDVPGAQDRRQSYYRWLADPVIFAHVARDAGGAACDRTMWRVCSTNGWWSVFGKKHGRTGKKTGSPVHDDLVERNFTAES